MVTLVKVSQAGLAFAADIKGLAMDALESQPCDATGTAQRAIDEWVKHIAAAETRP
jgi:hypothetical protein